MVSNNLIRYQFTQVISAKDAESKQKEINKLKLLLDEKYPDIKKMDYGIGSKQHDAFDFIGPLYESLSNNQSLDIDNSVFSSFGIPILQPQTNSGKLSDLINTDHLKVNDSSEILVSVGRNDDKGKIEYKVELDKIKLKKQGVDQEFEATAFIVHMGKTMKSGHYVAYVKENDNNWYEYNDNKKTKISGNQLEERKKEAYIIKYSEVGTKLPNPQSGSVNLGNTCWSNASCAFLGAFTSFEKYKDVKLDDKEKEMIKVHDFKEEIKGKKKQYEKLASKTFVPTDNKDKDEIAIKKPKKEYDVEKNYAQELVNYLRDLASEIRENTYKDLQPVLDIIDSLKLTESSLKKDISKLNLDEGKIKKYCELCASYFDKTANEVENHFKKNSSISDSDLEEYFNQKFIINITEFIEKFHLLNEDKAPVNNGIKSKNNSEAKNLSQFEIKKTTDNKKNLLKEIKSDFELKDNNKPEIASKLKLLKKLEKLEARDSGKYTKDIEILNDKIKNIASNNTVIERKYKGSFSNELEIALKTLKKLSQKNPELSKDIEKYYPKTSVSNFDLTNLRGNKRSNDNQKGS